MWSANKPISEQNLNGLLTRVDQLEQGVIDGKTLVASAITAMNQSTSANDTHAQLAQKVRDISKDATANPADVAAGASFYQGGLRRIGTKPKRSGHVTGQSISRSGTTLRIRPVAGDYPGDSGNSVQWNDPNFIASNIKKDIPLMGLTGTMPETVSDSGIATSYIDGVYERLEVRGLGFRPTFVVAIGPYGDDAIILRGMNHYTNLSSNFRQNSTNFTLYSDGFNIILHQFFSSDTPSPRTWSWRVLKSW